MTEEVKPLDEVAKFGKLQEWQTALLYAQDAKKLIEREQELRKEVFAIFFDAPKEGTNNYELANGWKLKGTYKLERKLDEAALPAVKEKLTEMQVNSDVLVRWVPELATKEYKSLLTLNPEAAKEFDAALTTKPGSPVLELIPPKEQ
ncbi:MAG: hypothetical protein KGI54_16955 [Pseudomonadota bacterium]|nr:hypothetical protein [Pseudomonadota bacterium]